ncbi:MnhB domain-containing protein [Shouchella shacheensis]|uniref:MnhB domain-containing protein n=1 Tax=Shouchella shacheensis TaxID=1649580 RepID=UPI00073FDEB2|nr:MnhB domain-containing protein [Shouchella shacheensis]
MKYSKSHDVLQRNLITITIYFLLGFSFYLFFAGHNNPGGGFIGGLMTACSLMLLYVIFDRPRANDIIRYSFVTMIAVGLLIGIGVGFLGVIFGSAYLEQFFDYFEFPFFGELELTTALPFDLGIYLVVVGMGLVITLTVAEDES